MTKDSKPKGQKGQVTEVCSNFQRTVGFAYVHLHYDAEIYRHWF